MSRPPMTAKQFQDRLHRLVGQAIKNGFCQLCMLRDLLAVVQVLQDHVNPTPADLEQHGLPLDEAAFHTTEFTTRH